MATVTVNNYEFKFSFDSQGYPQLIDAYLDFDASNVSTLDSDSSEFHIRDDSSLVKIAYASGMKEGNNVLTFNDFSTENSAVPIDVVQSIEVYFYDINNSHYFTSYPASFQSDTEYLLKKDVGLSTIKNQLTMKQKNFFQEAVSAILRLGKGNGLFKYENSKINAYAADETTRLNLAVADAAADQDAVTLKQLNSALAQQAKKGAMIITDLVSSANPWGNTEVRIGADLTFEWKDESGTQSTFTPAHGSVISVAKELTINAGYIANDSAEDTLYADHIYIYDATNNNLYDNGANFFYKKKF